jgi:hypothetical protein
MAQKVEESTEEVDDGKFSLRLNHDWRISADSNQFILQKKSSIGWVSQSYVATHTHILSREISARDIHMTPEAKQEFDKLPENFREFKKQAE